MDLYVLTPRLFIEPSAREQDDATAAKEYKFVYSQFRALDARSRARGMIHSDMITLFRTSLAAWMLLD